VTRDLLRLLDRGYQIMWAEDDPERALRGLSPDFEWIVPEHPEGALRRGPEATIAFFREWVEPWAELVVDWKLHPAGPDQVLAELTMRGRGRVSGAPAEMHVAQLWTFHEGEARRMVLYNDVAEARRAAGLER
jgi:ketosteroid isomerase-like protein